MRVRELRDSIIFGRLFFLYQNIFLFQSVVEVTEKLDFWNMYGIAMPLYICFLSAKNTCIMYYAYK